MGTIVLILFVVFIVYGLRALINKENELPGEGYDDAPKQEYNRPTRREQAVQAQERLREAYEARQNQQATIQNPATYDDMPTYHRLKSKAPPPQPALKNYPDEAEKKRRQEEVRARQEQQRERQKLEQIKQEQQSQEQQRQEQSYISNISGQQALPERKTAASAQEAREKLLADYDDMVKNQEEQQSAPQQTKTQQSAPQQAADAKQAVLAQSGESQNIAPSRAQNTATAAPTNQTKVVADYYSMYPTSEQ